MLLPTQSCLHFTSSLGHRPPSWLTSWTRGAEQQPFSSEMHWRAIPEAPLVEMSSKAQVVQHLEGQSLLSQEGSRESEGLVRRHMKSWCWRLTENSLRTSSHPSTPI